MPVITVVNIVTRVNINTTAKKAIIHKSRNIVFPFGEIN